ncbi:MAG: hypothetical protein AAF409_10180 [Pseudomonadota bacterium]
MKTGFFLLFAGLALAFPNIAKSQNPEFIVIPNYVEHVERPNIFNDLRVAFRQCLEEEACNKLVRGAEAAVGIPPGTSEGIVRVSDAFGLGPRVKNSGFHRYQWFDAPAGYSFCSMSAFATSAGRTRPGELYVALKADRMRVITFVDNPNPIQKERNIKAWLNTTLIRTDRYAGALAKGICNVKRCWNVGVRCKGAGCGLWSKIGEDPALKPRYGAIPSCPGDYL